MRIEELKKGFRGYKEEDVHRYIADLEDDYSHKLQEKDESLKKENEMLKRKIQELEEELVVLRRSYEKDKNQQELISGALIEAQAYAAQLKEKRLKQEQEEQKKLEEEVNRQRDELTLYKQKIEGIRMNFVALLREMDGSLEELEQNIETLESETPKKNLSLFQKISDDEKEE